MIQNMMLGAIISQNSYGGPCLNMQANIVTYNHIKATKFQPYYYILT